MEIYMLKRQRQRFFSSEILVLMHKSKADSKAILVISAEITSDLLISPSYPMSPVHTLVVSFVCSPLLSSSPDPIYCWAVEQLTSKALSTPSAPSLIPLVIVDHHPHRSRRSGVRCDCLRIPYMFFCHKYMQAKCRSIWMEQWFLKKRQLMLKPILNWPCSRTAKCSG